MKRGPNSLTVGISFGSFLGCSEGDGSRRNTASRASPHRFAEDFDSTGALKRRRNGVPSGYVNRMSTSKPTFFPLIHSRTLIVIAEYLPATPLVFRRATRVDRRDALANGDRCA